MWKLAAGLLAIAVISLAVLTLGDGSARTSAGPLIPPPGTDEFDVNGEVDIDITLCCGTSETVPLTGKMHVERGPDKGGTIPIEIVALELSGNSSLLGSNTPVTVSLNPNAGSPATGQLIPLKNFAQFSIPFMDVQIGDFGHYLQQSVDMQGEIVNVPFGGGEKFTSLPKANPIQSNDDPDPKTGLRGTLDRLNIDIKPPEQTYTITVLKQHADTKEPLPGWEMNLYAGHGCNGTPIDHDFTGGDGIAEFTGLTAGDYSVEEKLQDGWNNITPLCQDTGVPTTAGSTVGGLPACPIQPDAPFPDPGCDEFNSAASVNVEFTNPPGARLHCDLGGPTQITRSAVSGSPDNVQTAISVLDLTGTCEPGSIAVTVRQSPDIPSTGKITEQQNAEPGVLEFNANSFFDVYFEVDVGGTTLHNQEALHLECKIQGIPPYGCFYEPDVGTVALFNADKKEVATLIHAAHIPLDPKQKLLIFTNEPKPDTPTSTPESDTPTPGADTPTITATPTETPTAAKTPQPQRTRHATLRCVRTSADQKVTGSVTVTEKKDDKPPQTVLEASCNSNTDPVVRVTYSISAGATKNVAMHVNVDSRTNDCPFHGFAATQRVSVSCTASPEGLEFLDTEFEAGGGDANKNGAVDSIDAALILQEIAGLTDPWPNADVNGDGTTDAIDVALILQFVAGLVPGLPL